MAFDPLKIAAELIDLTGKKSVMLCCAESCTGGLLAATLTQVAGSSAMFDRGFVTYTNRAKIDMLGVSPDTLDRFGAVSEQAAAEMAQGALHRSSAAVAVSITGIAGPGGSEHKPEGRVCFGLATAAGIATETVDFGVRGRDAVRLAARDHALVVLRDAVRGLPAPTSA